MLIGLNHKNRSKIMNPRVLIKNAQLKLSSTPQGLIPTTWDEDSFWMGKDFSFAQAFDATSDLSLSPFVLTEAHISFVLCLLVPDAPTYFKGVPELGALAFRLRSQHHFVSDFFDEDLWSEYSSKKVQNDYPGPFSQMVYWNFEGDEYLSRLTETGRVILVSSREMPKLLEGFYTEEKFSYREDSEIGEIYVHMMKR